MTDTTQPTPIRTLPTEVELAAEYAITKPRLDELRAKMTLPGDLAIRSNYEITHRHLIDLKKIRGAIEKRRKELKADSLEFGRRVDAVAKHLTAELDSIAAPLQAAKDAADRTAEEERKRLEEQARLEREAKERAAREAEEERLRQERLKLDEERRRLEQEAEKIRQENARLLAEREKLEQQQRERERQEREATAPSWPVEPEPLRTFPPENVVAPTVEPAEPPVTTPPAPERVAPPNNPDQDKEDASKLGEWVGGVRLATRSPCPLATPKYRGHARKTAATILDALAALERVLSES